MIQGRRTVLDYLFFLRPVLLPPVWTIALLGTIRSGLTHEMHVGLWVVFFLHLTALFGGVYTLNQICDVESDKLNKKLYFIPEGIISINSAWRFTIALEVLALSLSILFGWRHLLLTAFIVILGILYSVGSAPWKNHPLLGLISNAVGHGFVVFLFGFVATACPITESWLTGAAYSLGVGAVYLATTVPDVEGDRLTGKRTPAVQWGERMTMIAAVAMVGTAIGLAAWIGDRYLAIAGIAAFPLFVLSMIRPSNAASAAKVAVGALSIAAAIAYPPYLILLISGFVGTRLFFRWRFGISYPNFV
jgi:4-hydroxybenzoate polyprenyltransferase